MTDDRRDQLAEALYDTRVVVNAAWLADALLPTVDRMIREAQADLLTAIAAETRHISAGSLRDRAAALRDSQGSSLPSDHAG